MKDEIKEIIELIKTKYKDYYIDDFLSGEDIKKLVDYITNLQTIEQQYSAILSENVELENKLTNLQEENKKLKEIVENLTTMTVCGDIKQIKNTAQYKLDIYKSRNEKAIEYIKNNLSLGVDTFGSVYSIGANKVLNILNGGDDND